MKKIIVLGGGTAGWLTAIYIRKIMPDAHINLIQSEDVGIVGVGEATTQPFIPFLNSLGIDFKDVLKKTNGTIKNGISFENWNGDNKKYFHSFGMDKIVDFKIPFIFDHNCFDFYIKNVINQKLNLEEYQYSSLLSYKNKVDVDKNNFALHFDASLMARYLQNVGIDRNITVVSGLVSRVLSDDNELITGLLLENGVEINCDFIFDCSGLSRLLIGLMLKRISNHTHQLSL
jgi:tryptophan halogenase